VNLRSTGLVPSTRLIVLVAILGLPAATAAALWPGAKLASIAVIAALGAATLIDAALRGRTLAGLRIEVPALARFFKDRAGDIRIRVHNETGLQRTVRIGLVAPDGIDAPIEEQLVELPAGAQTAEFLWTCTPRRRGQYRLDAAYLEAPSPLGLWLVRRQDSVALEIRVYPNLRSDTALRALKRRTEGSHALRQLGRGREFEKLREYIAGDGSDEIHWKATARRGHPVTKVFQIERTQEIYVVIDASRLSGRIIGRETALERAISATLLVGAAAERRGDLFGVAAFSDKVQAFTRARSGKAHFAACRDAIYQLHPRSVSPDFEEIATFLRLQLRRRALLVFLTSLDDPVLAESFTRATHLLAKRHLVLVGMLRPAAAQPLFHDARVDSPSDIYRQLAGHLSWRKLRELESTLARQGVRLALLEPESLIGSLIGLYDQVKQRQLL
jgi:uncharacterized protein (DUF58 family)